MGKWEPEPGQNLRIKKQKQIWPLFVDPISSALTKNFADFPRCMRLQVTRNQLFQDGSPTFIFSDLYRNN